MDRKTDDANLIAQWHRIDEARELRALADDLLALAKQGDLADRKEIEDHLRRAKEQYELVARLLLEGRA